jgi:cell division protein FtsL
MATRKQSSDDMDKRREQVKKYRIQRRRMDEERKRRRRLEFIRSIKLFFIVTGVVVSAVAVFILFSGAWSIVNPIINGS